MSEDVQEVALDEIIQNEFPAPFFNIQYVAFDEKIQAVPHQDLIKIRRLEK